MSRRITFFLLAAAAALIASPASADRECFENSCRLPGVIEPPIAEPEPEAQAAAVPDEAQPALARHNMPAQNRLAPLGAVPPVLPPVVQAKSETRPAPKVMPKFTPPARRAAEETFAPREPERVELRDSAEAPAEPVRVAPAGRVRGERVAVGYGVSHGAGPGGAAVIQVPGAVASPQPAPFYPYAAPDPAYRSCQAEGVRGVVYCGPTSYHPYGAYGYRPNGTYAAYQAPAIYAVAPDAKIITIEDGDN